MDRSIDMSNNREVAVAILSLHRFAIAALIKAKSERAIEDFEPLVKVFLSLPRFLQRSALAASSNINATTCLEALNA